MNTTVDELTTKMTSSFLDGECFRMFLNKASVSADSIIQLFQLLLEQLHKSFFDLSFIESPTLIFVLLLL